MSHPQQFIDILPLVWSQPLPMRSHRSSPPTSLLSLSVIKSESRYFTKLSFPCGWPRSKIWLQVSHVIVDPEVTWENVLKPTLEY